MMKIKEPLQNNDSLQRIFDFIMHIMGMTYNVLTTIPMDLLTEIHLRLGRKNRIPEKKILAYWDFNQRVGKLGDFIIFLETLNVLRDEFNLDMNKKNIDLCFIDDANHYNAKKIKFAKNYLFKKNILSLVPINPFIDSVFFFTSNSEFERFYKQNKDRYVRWPGTVSGTATYDVRIIENYYTKNKIIPLLKLPSEILSEVYDFYKENVYPSMPVVINIRKNIRQPDKNSNLSEIKKFLKKYDENKNYRFIIICNKSEIPEDFRELKNVLFSKDHFESMEYDLAFIKSSYLNIFPRSGMACFAWYADVPLIQFGNHGQAIAFYSSPTKEYGFDHFSAYQKLYLKNETANLLISRFEDMVKYLREKNINNTLRNEVNMNSKNIPKF